MRKQQGFTLIELLVVIAIIGLLSTLAVVALGTARVKARDAKRLADLKQVQTALELYYTDLNQYPSGTATVLGTGSAACLNGNGWQSASCSNAYMASVPTDPSGGTYTYTAASGTYYINATLENASNGLSAGAIHMNPNGIFQNAGS